MFGQKMRRIYLPDAFGWQGKVVLVLIGALICAGWVLVAIK
jgi:purine-cytosine permease-like protein